MERPPFSFSESAGTTASVFIGSSSESRDVAEVVASLLGRTFTCVPWWTAFPPSSFTLQALARFSRQHRFAIFVGAAHDYVESRGVKVGAVRDNVFGEFMMFVGANGYDHTFLLLDTSRAAVLPTDLKGFVWEPFDGAEFRTSPSGALSAACDRLAQQLQKAITEDRARERHLTRLALSEARTVQLLELAEVVSLLRDVIDALQRDTLEALLDEAKFTATKRGAKARIDTLCGPQEQKASACGVGPEFLQLKESLLATVEALPFPSELFRGIDDARTAYGHSVLGSVAELARAVEEEDYPKALRVALGLRGKISTDALAEEVARIAELQLSRLKSNYSNWWRANSSAILKHSNAFQGAIVRAQTSITLQVVRSSRESDVRT